MNAALRDWLRSMELLGSAKTSSKILPPFGVELVHSEGVRSRSFLSTYWDPTPAELDVEAARRRRGLWSPAAVDPIRVARFRKTRAGFPELAIVDVPLPGMDDV